MITYVPLPEELQPEPDPLAIEELERQWWEQYAAAHPEILQSQENEIGYPFK